MRTKGDPRDALPIVRDSVRAIDPALAVRGSRRWTSASAAALAALAPARRATRVDPVIALRGE